MIQSTGGVRGERSGRGGGGAGEGRRRGGGGAGAGNGGVAGVEKGGQCGMDRLTDREVSIGLSFNLSIFWKVISN